MWARQVPVLVQALNATMRAVAAVVAVAMALGLAGAGAAHAGGTGSAERATSSSDWVWCCFDTVVRVSYSKSAGTLTFAWSAPPPATTNGRFCLDAIQWSDTLDEDGTPNAFIGGPHMAVFKARCVTEGPLTVQKVLDTSETWDRYVQLEFVCRDYVLYDSADNLADRCGRSHTTYWMSQRTKLHNDADAKPASPAKQAPAGKESPFDGTWTGHYSGTRTVEGHGVPFDARITFTVAGGAITGSFTGSVGPGGTGSVSAGSYQGFGGPCRGSLVFSAGSVKSTGTVVCEYTRGVTASGVVTAERVGGPKPEPTEETEPGTTTKPQPKAKPDDGDKVEVDTGGAASCTGADGKRRSQCGAMKPGDTISTGSAARVTLLDGSTLVLGKGAKWQYCGVSRGRGGGPVACKVGGTALAKGARVWRQMSGSIHYRIAKQRSRPVVIYSRYVGVSVRGTAFTIDQLATGIDRVQVDEGSVALLDVGTQCPAVVVRKGFQADVTARGACARTPMRFTRPKQTLWDAYDPNPAARWPAASSAVTIEGDAQLIPADGSVRDPVSGRLQLAPGDEIGVSDGSDDPVRVRFANGTVAVLDGVEHGGYPAALSVREVDTQPQDIQVEMGVVWLSVKRPVVLRTYYGSSLISTTNAAFTVEDLGDLSRLRVYAGEVTVAWDGGTAARRPVVVVRAGYEITTPYPAGPSTPRRFTPAANPFWTTS